MQDLTADHDRMTPIEEALPHQRNNSWIAVGYLLHGRTPLNTCLKVLGSAHGHVLTKAGRCAAWRFEGAILTVPIRDGAPCGFRVEADQFKDSVLTDLLWDLEHACGNRILGRSQYAALGQIGRRACFGHELKLSRAETPVLKKFVLDYCDGRIVTDRDVPPNMIGMVFLPISLGALQPQGEAAKALEALPEAPPHPESPSGEPVPPEALVLPPKPTTPEPVVHDPVKLEEIEFSIRWQDADPSVRVVYENALVVEREIRQKFHDEDVGTWETTCVELQKEHTLLMKDHQEKTAAWEALQDPQGKARVARETACHDAIRQGFMKRYTRDLGVIYAIHGEDTTCGRSINGYPIFFSMRLLHREDWTRVAKAITDELKRRSEMEL